MKKFVKIIIMSVVLVLLVTLVVLAMVFDVNLGLFKNLSVASVNNKNEEIEELATQEETELGNFEESKNALEKSKNTFDVEKEKYENISSSDLEIVKNALVDEKYLIEYIWVTLGNYATENNLRLNIVTQGDNGKINYVSGTLSDLERSLLRMGIGAQDIDWSIVGMGDSDINVVGPNDRIKVIVKGRYSNVSDFVFDVENDKALRFKLDNIKMVYAENNEVGALFDIFSLNVEK